MLSPREIQVVQQVAQGRGDKDIAKNLGISHHTVKDYVDVARHKLGAVNRTALAAIAVRQGVA